jgi:hypothetical protein
MGGKMKEIAAALVSAQSAFQPALKNSQNPHFRSKYADLGACIDAVINALHANGIALIQHTAESDKGVIISTTFLHKSGEIYEAGTLFVPAAQQTPQAYGSALTYARRYSLMTACGIAPEDDDGNEGSRAGSRYQTDAQIIQPDVWSISPQNADLWQPKGNDYKSSAEVSADAPLCNHGEMTLREGVKDGKPYRGYTCKEKGENQCSAIWMVKSKTTGEWRFKDEQ